MADQSLNINFDHIGRAKEGRRNKYQPAYDERYYAVKTNYQHLSRVLYVKTFAGDSSALMQGTVSPALPIKKPTFLQNLIAEVKFRLKQLKPFKNRQLTKKYYR